MTDILARLQSAVADRYRIDRELGAGGMATVYVAHDLRHERDVAIKVLHADLAAALGGERFLTEIRTTARLQHPHILSLLDSGAAAGSLFYVMPLVRGESLRQRLDRERQLPIDDALRIAREVAAAIDYAHRQGIVHRDIKPDNILLHEGSALVADFGIALAVQSAGGQRMTQTGLSLGTPQYMSPEQAMGERSLDARSDLYSLAAVTYEMLTGEPPFTGATVQAVVAKVISAEPQAITLIRRSVPPAVATAVHRGLEKLPADRFTTVADFAHALSGTTAGPVAIRSDTRPGDAPSVLIARFRKLAPWLAAAGIGAAAWLAGRANAVPDESGARGPVVATLLPDDGELWSGSGVNFALSADGRQVTMAAQRAGVTELIVRSLDSAGSRRLPDTRGAFYPFWSPDGRAIGFFADNQLKVIDLATGGVRALCPATRPGGGSWGADGVIIYRPEAGVGLYRVSSSGGGCGKLSVTTPAQALDGKPRFLPDGRHFVSSTDLGAWLGAIDGDSLTLLTGLQRMRAVVAGPDWLLFRPPGAPSGSIFAQRIDVRGRRMVGEPVRVLDDVSSPGGNTALAASHNGVLVARMGGGSEGGRVLARFDWRGALLDTISLAGQARVFGPHRLSHDGRRMAFGGWEIAVMDLGRQVTTVVARSPSGRTMRNPAWSPRDTAIAFVTYDSGRYRIGRVDVRTSKVDTIFMRFVSGRDVELKDWSADGRYLAFQYGAGGGTAWNEAWVYDFTTDSIRRLFEETGHVYDIAISPDGRRVAYQVGFGGADAAVFMRPFPGPGTHVRVSPGDGNSPRWSAEGTKLFYREESSGIMEVSVSPDGATLTAPRLMLSLAALRSVAPTSTGGFIFDATPDGRGVLGSVTRPRPVDLTLILDWWKLLERAYRP